MTKKLLPVVSVALDRIIGGGQTIGTLEDGKKCLAWGGLPGEKVTVQLTKKKSSFVEGYVIEVVKPSKERTEPRDAGSYLSTSPWQIMKFAAEEHYKSALIEEAFELHDIVLPSPIGVWSDGREFEYRNKVEFSFWYDTDKEQLDLAFFRRGSHGKIAVEGTSLASHSITKVSTDVLNTLRELKIDGRALKTLLIRSNRAGEVAWQLYVKSEDFNADAVLKKAVSPEVICAEVIYSNPKSPASVITKRLAASSDRILTDRLLDVPFRYATEGFFQINLPVYEQALREMERWMKYEVPRPLDLDAAQGAGEARNKPYKRYGEVSTGTSNAAMRQIQRPVVDLYSGVGTIGLTIGGLDVTLVEMNEHAVREMERNIAELGKKATVVLAASEQALEYISEDATIIVDPPRAGLHEKVVQRLLETAPKRIIYLSCNPVTQARDVARLAEKYGIRHHQGYNFFPRTPHIEHLVILDRIDTAG
jgi:23S rRNA (uracil1939-C5)-methyltransferase